MSLKVLEETVLGLDLDIWAAKVPGLDHEACVSGLGNEDQVIGLGF